MAVTTIDAVMQMRRGLENDLDISQLRIGEWALSTDKKWVRICYAQGKVIKIASQEAMDETLAEIQEIEDAILVMKNAAAASALSASGSATTATTKAGDAEAWAVGKRDGTDVPSTDPAYHNNAKYWSEQAQHATQLSGLTDVEITSPANGQTLKYDSALQKWENADEANADVKSATNSFSTVNGGLLDELSIKMNPGQDLHGYSKPWAGGAGKNKYAVSATTQTISGVTVTVNNDGSFNANGRATADVYLDLGDVSLDAGTWLGSCGVVGDWNTYGLYIRNVTDASTIAMINSLAGYTFTLSATKTIRLVLLVKSGQEIDLDFYPMIRLASIADPTFEPYSNICPISGHTEAESFIEGKNILDIPSSFSSGTLGGVTFTVNRNEDGAVTSIVLNGTASSQIYPYFDFTLSAGSYTINGVTGGTDSTYYVDVQNRTTITNVAHLKNGDVTFSVSERTTFRAYINVISGTVLNNVVMRFMVRHASNPDSTFEPYKGKTYATDLGTTVYGGEVDQVSGDGVVDTYFETFTSCVSVDVNPNSYGIRNAVLKTITDAFVINTCMSDKFERQTSYLADTKTVGIFNNTSFTTIRVDSSIGTDKASVDAWLAANPVQIAVKLATPTSLSVTGQKIPANAGENTLSATRTGQSIKTNGVKYKEVFDWEDVTDEINDSENDIYKVMEIKNRLPYPYTDSGNKSTNGIDFVDNGDGTITIKSGTASANATYWLRGNGTTLYESLNDLKGENYVISCGFESIPNVVAMNVNFYDSSRNYLSGFTVTNSGGAFNIPDNAAYYVAFLRVYSGKAVSSNIVAYPMLRLASITDPTYQPYAMTNKELTDKVIVKTLTLTAGTNVSNVDNIYAYQIGKVVYITGFYQASANMAAKETAISGLPKPKASSDMTRPMCYVQGNFALGSVEGNNFYIRSSVNNADTVVVCFSYVVE